MKGISTELIGIDNPFDSPWDAADKHYPGGFEAYFHEVLCCDKIINKYENSSTAKCI